MINLNKDFIKMPLIFATNLENREYCNKNTNYIYLWDSPTDKLPVYLIKDTKKMEQELIVRMQNPMDFKSNSIEIDVMNEIKKLMNESE